MLDLLIRHCKQITQDTEEAVCGQTEVEGGKGPYAFGFTLAFQQGLQSDETTLANLTKLLAVLSQFPDEQVVKFDLKLRPVCLAETAIMEQTQQRFEKRMQLEQSLMSAQVAPVQKLVTE